MSLAEEQVESPSDPPKPQSKSGLFGSLKNTWKFVLNRLIDLPWLVKGVVFVDLGATVAFHVVKILVIYDLHTINYHPQGREELILLRHEEYSDATKSLFWTLCGVTLELNLHTTSVVVWGILIYGLIHGDPSWMKAWSRLRKVLIFSMIIPNIAMDFGGKTHFTLVNTIVFFVYYIEAVLAIEVVSRFHEKIFKIPTESISKTE